ncbi:MAG: ArnT family glycosyltransferase [Chitinophagaceae bacterium]
MLRGSYHSLKNETRIEFIIGLLCIVVYCGSLFFPLLDKDAAHHANIALHMYETGDYFSLVDRGEDYLDKPHLLFWTTLAFFKIFGVTTIAHRLPAVLFALVSVYCVYQLTRHLTNKPTARIAAIILATAQAFVLSVNDARMETPLTTGITLGLWQLIVYTDKKKFINLLLGTFGIGIAFATKGWLGPVVVFIAVFFYILLNRRWAIMAKPLTWLFIPFFFLIISPVLYGYYLQYDLHPEKMIRGRDNISGVKFILWEQLFERYKGFDKKRYSDPFFLYHTFMWAFLPWCIAGYIALFYWLRRMLWLKKWKHPVNFTALAFGFILVTLSFSKFKMPHYLIMLFPLATIFTAPYLRHVLSFRRGIKMFFPVQAFLAIVMILLAAALNYYFFKPANVLLLIIGPLLLIAIIALWTSRSLQQGMKIIYLSAAASLIFNLLLNYNFFQQLLKYQAGNEMARDLEEKKVVIPATDIILIEPNAHSFDFYTGHNHALLPLDEFDKNYPLLRDKYFFMNRADKRALQQNGYRVESVVNHVDYNVAKVSLKFLNPASREKRFDTLVLAKVYRE